ncbi:MAG: heme biosynthesis HemY N-terminal domain-containing protein [Hyphomicrobium sp.]
MVRLVIYLLSILLIASGLAWLADRPGTLQIAWQGYDIETSVFRAAVMLAAAIAAAIFLWSLVRAVWNSPAALGNRIIRRRQKRGLEALSSGMIAVGAGDRALATRYAMQARKALPHEPLTHLLRAQAAQLSGDRATTRRIYEAMLASPETEQLGLRGLFLEAEREGETEAAVQYADRALKTNPKLGWSAEALFDLQCKQKNWAEALSTLSNAKRSGHLDKAGLDRKRAVLLAAQAQDAEENETDKALGLALEAHNLAPDLVPAAAVAGRILAARGNTGKAAKVLQKAWARAPHPELANVYAHARIGDSTRDRLDRVRQLAALNPQSIESAIAVATTAIDAKLFSEARKALEPLLTNRLTQRVATLMARIEAGDGGDKGKVREWLARAANAARDPVWFADGVISNRWEPVSPVTGRLDAFQWRVPAEALDPTHADLVASRIEELLAISGPLDNADDHAPATATPAASLRREADIIDAEAVTVAPARGAQAPRAAEPLKPEKLGATATFQRGQDRTNQPTTVLPATVNTPAAAAAARAAAQAEPPRGEATGSADAKIFVAPRAPDDPGLEDSDIEALPPFVKRPFRAVK